MGGKKSASCICLTENFGISTKVKIGNTTIFGTYSAMIDYSGKNQVYTKEVFHFIVPLNSYHKTGGHTNIREIHLQSSLQQIKNASFC